MLTTQTNSISSIEKLQEYLFDLKSDSIDINSEKFQRVFSLINIDSFSELSESNIKSLIYNYYINLETSSKLEKHLMKISNKEMLFLRDLFNKEGVNILRLSFTLLIHRYLYYFPNEWIEFNKNQLFQNSGLQALSSKDKSALINTCFTKNIIDFRVIGKKKSRICFYLPWATSTNSEFPNKEDGIEFVFTLKTVTSEINNFIDCYFAK